MANDEGTLSAFIERPDTAALMFRYSQLVQAFIKERPYIRMGKRLTGNYVIAYTQRDRVRDILAEIGFSNIGIHPLVCSLFGEAELEASGILPVHRQPGLSLRGQGVMLGFIDTGIDYTLPAFRHADGATRIRRIWDQTIRGDGPMGKHDGEPDSFGYGTEYTEEDINAALRADDPRAIVPHRDTAGHGTFLASVAGSNEPGVYIGAAPDAEFLIVKLRRATPHYINMYLVPPETEHVYETSDIMLGIEYILSRAIQLNRPVAICISAGTNLGAHNGSNILEEYMTRISFVPGLAVCAAAGNESAARHHASGTIPGTGETATIDLRTGDSGSSFVVCLWNNDTDRIAVSLRSPAGEVIPRIPARSGTSHEANLVLEQSAVRVQYAFPVEGNGGQLTMISLSHPAPGVWHINAYGEIILDGTYHAWLPVTGLADPAVEFMSPAPDTTVCVPATGMGVITCGAYDSLNNSLFASTSWGPTRLPSIAPDLTAPGVAVRGIFPDGHGAMSGTSVAAAIASGAAALMLEWGIVRQNEPSMNTYIVRANLIRGCSRDSGLEYPNMQWGYGRLNLLRTFQVLRGI